MSSPPSKHDARERGSQWVEVSVDKANRGPWFGCRPGQAGLKSSGHVGWWSIKYVLTWPSIDYRRTGYRPKTHSNCLYNILQNWNAWRVPDGLICAVFHRVSFKCGEKLKETTPPINRNRLLSRISESVDISHFGKWFQTCFLKKKLKFQMTTPCDHSGEKYIHTTFVMLCRPMLVNDHSIHNYLFYQRA